MKLRALRPFHFAPLRRSVAAGEVFVADVFDALELADGINAEMIDDRDRAQFRRRDRAAWIRTDIDRERLALDPAAVEAIKADMKQPAIAEGYVRRWRPKRRRIMFGVQV